MNNLENIQIVSFLKSSFLKNIGSWTYAAFVWL
jgi:hypothetical protein